MFRCIYFCIVFRTKETHIVSLDNRSLDDDWVHKIHPCELMMALRDLNLMLSLFFFAV